MMKKLLATLLLAVTVLSLASCGESGSSKTAAKTQGVNDVLNQAIEGETEPETAAEAKKSEKTASGEKADVDLTELSSTMVYSEVYNMMSDPNKYVGKTIRMQGTVDVYEGEDKTYYSCQIKDAAACCAQGIEFVLTDGNYPKLGEEVTVYGVFDTYKEDVYTYCQLIDAKMEA